MATYIGRRGPNGPQVFVVTPRNASSPSLYPGLEPFGPDGFDWTADDEEADQFARIWLSNAVDEEAACTCFREFREQFIQQLPYDAWQRTDQSVREWFYALKRDRCGTDWESGEYVESDWQYYIEDARQQREEPSWELAS